MCERSLRLKEDCIDQFAYHVLMVEQLYRDAHKYDIIHSHIDYFPYTVIRRMRTPCLTTLHGRLDLPDLIPLYREFADIPLVSISDAQRLPLPDVNWQATVYHGIPSDAFSLREKPGYYLAFLGRISPEKGPDRAIEIAKLFGMKLKIAAKVDASDRKYFEEEIAPLLDDPLIEFIGEISEKEKDDFLGNAFALLVPVDWPEPFGMVMIEAMACGTPVIAHPRGSIPEIVREGVTGSIVTTTQEAVEALEKLRDLDRAACRRYFEEHFTSSRMARDYIALYERLMGSRRSFPPRKEYSNERYYTSS